MVDIVQSIEIGGVRYPVVAMVLGEVEIPTPESVTGVVQSVNVAGVRYPVAAAVAMEE